MILKPQDLRIGNYIQDEHGNICQIYEMTDYGRVCVGKEKLVQDLQNCEPITLTEELLLKCGFELRASHIELSQYRYDDFDITFEKDSNRFLLDYYRNLPLTKKDIEITYLHHLQSIMYDLGKELEIKL